VQAAFRDPRLSADRITGYRDRLDEETRRRFEPTFDIFSRWAVFNDPPAHTRLRGLVHKAFTPRVVASLQPRITAVAEGLLDDVEEHAELDLISDFSYHLTATVIAEMLGVPASDRAQFKAWSDDLLLLVFGALDVPDRHARGQHALLELAAYLGELAGQRADQPGDDLITRLVQVEDDGDTLTREETAAMCTMLLFAGHETTTNLIANGVLALLQHPDQLRKLRADPALASTAVEEMLRYDGPVKSLIRVVTEDHERHGVQLSRGDRVFLLVAAANRDPRRFTEPDRFDITRADSSAHLGFGFGIHYCLGASLARLETALGIEVLLRRYPDLALGEEELTWQPTLISRALTRLPVRVRPAGAPAGAPASVAQCADGGRPTAQCLPISKARPALPADQGALAVRPGLGIL
jgi:cytochrome P450